MKKSLLLAVLPLLLAGSAATAETISPALQGILDYTRSDEPVSVIVYMTEQAPVAQLSATLSEGKASRQERHNQIVVALQEVARSQNGLIAELEAAKSDAGGVIGYTSYWISNLIVVQAIPDEILRIADHPDVAWLEPNFVPELIEPVIGAGDQPGGDEQMFTNGIGTTPGVEAVRAREVWEVFGFTGAGRIVASCDTGVDGDHPALGDRWRGLEHPWQECWLDVLGGNTEFPEDDGGHGTHTCGTMTGIAPDDTIGVAPGAQWIATNLIDQGVSSQFDNDVFACYQWFADPDGNPFTDDDVPDVVCNSWGVNENFPGYIDCDPIWWNVISNCEAAGVVTVWAAGNEGSGSSTIRSPADRAASATSSFAVGAVNATNYGWPYPIWSASSRGPSTCSAPPELLIKPEIVGPGVSVYSSVPGGGYQGGWSGTSMSTPHVAGVVALMREANPDLEVAQIKQILMDTARDEGIPGDDNAYGHGFVDAMAAVEACLTGYGLVEGHVTNASFGGIPIVDAEVFLVENDRGYSTDADGYYSARVPYGIYTARVSAAGFADYETTIEVPEEGGLVENFSLVDNAGPWIDNVAEPISSSDETGPYPITADAADPSTVVQVVLYSRAGNGGWQQTAMVPQDGGFSGGLPGESANTQIDYYVTATDGAGYTSVSPAGAPVTTYTMYVTVQVYATDAETDDPAWQLGIPGDTATGGIWVRVDPNGTELAGEPVQPEDDHTADPGVMCFVTGNGEPGGSAAIADVDGGCTTLLSPTFDLAGADKAFVNYWRWFGEAGYYLDDQLEIAVSANGGASWTPLDIVVDNAAYWERVAVELGDYVSLTDQVVFRVLACDLEGSSVIEAAFDDFTVETFSGSGATAVGDEDLPTGDVFQLAQNHPNPFNPFTTISFSLPQTIDVELSVYSLDGRKVATLVRDNLPAGAHSVIWNGQDSRGQQVASGTYLYRLQAGTEVATRRMALLK